MLATVELDKLLQVVWVSLVAGIGITALFSIVIYGSSRAAELRRAGSGVAATILAGIAGLAVLAFAGSLVFAISVILSK